jgi:hypothetical protein
MVYASRISGFVFSFLVMILINDSFRRCVLCAHIMMVRLIRGFITLKKPIFYLSERMLHRISSKKLALTSSHIPSPLKKRRFQDEMKERRISIEGGAAELYV